jgi:Recombination endonuclease VII
MSKKVGNRPFVRFSRAGAAPVTGGLYGPEVKRCRKCGELKPLTAFYKEQGCRDGYRNDCKACFAARSKQWYLRNRSHVIARVKTWQQTNPERVKATRKAAQPRRRPIDRDARLRRVFGLSSDQYAAMLEDQGGGCALCGRTPPPGRSLHVDHDHETGVVRGLLCFRCNAGIGQFREDKLRLADAIVYLARGRHRLEPDRAERDLFVELVCELVGANCIDAERSPVIGVDGSAATGIEQTPE